MVPHPPAGAAGPSEGVTPAAPGGARADERELLALAAQLHRPLARAARLARSNGMGYAVFGVLTALLSLDDVTGLALGLVLLGVGLWERHHARRLLAGETDAPDRLALGEFALMIAICLYAALKLTVLRTSGAELEAQLGAGASDLGIAGLTDALTSMTYSIVIAVTLLYQGGMALYFRRRGPLLLDYLSQTPGWAREVVAGLPE